MISEILGLFVNILTADHRYSFQIRENFQESTQMQLSKKQKSISELFVPFFEIYIICWTFWEKVTLIAYEFPKLRLQNTQLDNCLKSPLSEHRSTVNMLKGRKHCWNLHDSTFTIFPHISEGKRTGKCLCYWYLKS